MREQITKEDKIDQLAERVHWAYCANYECRKGEEYWTKGDYSKLDEEAKEIDRAIVRAVLDGLREQLRAVDKPRIIV